MGYLLVPVSTAMRPFVTSIDSLYAVQIAGGFGREASEFQTRWGKAVL